jgi:hypothetical protein
MYRQDGMKACMFTGASVKYRERKKLYNVVVLSLTNKN